MLLLRLSNTEESRFNKMTDEKKGSSTWRHRKQENDSMGMFFMRDGRRKNLSTKRKKFDKSIKTLK